VAAGVVALAVFVVTAAAVWRFSFGESTSKKTTSTTIARVPVGVPAEIVSASQLRAIARVLGRPVYWAGNSAGTKIEYRQTADGTTYVRYLTGSAKVGDKRPDFVVVATYAQPNAYGRVQSIARSEHYVIEHLRSGGVAVTEPRSPRNIHLVFPGQPYQVEVYAPTAAQARSIVASGAITTVP
jgi:hypothetical protein